MLRTVRKGSFLNLSPTNKNKDNVIHSATTGSSTSSFLPPEKNKIKQTHALDDLVNGIYDPIITILDSCSIKEDAILHCKLCRLFHLS